MIKSTKNVKFLSSQKYYAYDAPPASTALAFYIRYDAGYDIYKRDVYTILNLLGDIGGF